MSTSDGRLQERLHLAETHPLRAMPGLSPFAATARSIQPSLPQKGFLVTTKVKNEVNGRVSATLELVAYDEGLITDDPYVSPQGLLKQVHIRTHQQAKTSILINPTRASEDFLGPFSAIAIGEARTVTSETGLLLATSERAPTVTQDGRVNCFESYEEHQAETTRIITDPAQMSLVGGVLGGIVGYDEAGTQALITMIESNVARLDAAIAERIGTAQTIGSVGMNGATQQ